MGKATQTSAESSFWPADLASELPTAPVTVLRRAAAELGQMTKNLLEGVVETSPFVDLRRKPMISHTFLVRAPTLDNYSVELFEAQHGTLLYPVTVKGDAFARQGIATKEIKDEASLAGVVRQILRSEYARKVVASMLAQVQG